MIFMGWWKDSKGDTHRGLVKADYADDAVMQLAYNLQEGCEVVNVMFFCESENDIRITPQMLCINFANTSDYQLFG